MRDAWGDILISSGKTHFSSASRLVLSPTITLFCGYERLSGDGKQPGWSWLLNPFSVVVKNDKKLYVYVFIVWIHTNSPFAKSKNNLIFYIGLQASARVCVGVCVFVCVCVCVTENAKSCGQSRIICSSWRHPLTSFPWPDMAAACTLIGKSILCVQVLLYALWQPTALIRTARFVKWTPRLAGQLARMGSYKRVCIICVGDTLWNVD